MTQFYAPIFMPLLLLSFTASAYNEIIVRSKFTLTANVVSSTCSVVIENNTSQSGVINFGEHNKATHSGLNKEQLFDVIVYESQPSLPGCSAFLAGSSSVSLNFGDQSFTQLDESGVITYGAGDGIRIAITSTDISEVDSNQKITSSNVTLNYPRDFAAKGVFGFRALVEGLEQATSGSYHGALSLTVSYQ